MLDQFKNERPFSKKTSERLKIINLKTHKKVYITSKIHKINNPWRPAINSINCYIFEISRFQTLKFTKTITIICEPHFIKS